MSLFLYSVSDFGFIYACFSYIFHYMVRKSSELSLRVKRLLSSVSTNIGAVQFKTALFWWSHFFPLSQYSPTGTILNWTSMKVHASCCQSQSWFSSFIWKNKGLLSCHSVKTAHYIVTITSDYLQWRNVCCFFVHFFL